MSDPNKEMELLSNYLQDVFPDPNTRMVQINYLGKYLLANTSTNTFYGTKHPCKSQMLNVLQDILGDYFDPKIVMTSQ